MKEAYKELEKTKRLFSNEFLEGLKAGDSFGCMAHELLYIEAKLIRLGAKYEVIKNDYEFYSIQIKGGNTWKLLILL